MKRLATLALLATAAAAASAQSTVTVYGIVDLGIVKGNGGTAVNPGALGTSRAWTVQERTSSRLGFRGNEDLGGGLSAQFQFEHRFRADTGAVTNPTFWHGRSFVQLSSATLGKVYLGREYSPTYWPANTTDPAGWDGVGQMGTHQYAGFTSTAGIRTNNTVGYRSPSFGGLTVDAAVSAGEGAARDAAINAQYRSGALYIGLAYERISGGPAATDGNSLANVGVTYNFGFVKAMGYYARAKVNGGRNSNDFYSLAGVVPVGNGEVYLGYGRLDLAVNNTSPDKWSAGYKYPLSKRTNLYADVGHAREDNRTDNTAYAFGVKHTF